MSWRFCACFTALSAGQKAFSTLFSTGTNQHQWQTIVELVGTVKPSNYKGEVILQRELLVRKIYDDMTLRTTLLNKPDTSFPPFRDDEPQSGNSNGKVYDVDGPGFSIRNKPDGTIERQRRNFRQYATIEDQTSDGKTEFVQASEDFLWFSRLSLKVNTASQNEIKNELETSVAGDNIAGAGTTNVTWDLK
jgi:hypothetical protein